MDDTICLLFQKYVVVNCLSTWPEELAECLSRSCLYFDGDNAVVRFQFSSKQKRNLCFVHHTGEENCIVYSTDPTPTETINLLHKIRRCRNIGT